LYDRFFCEDIANRIVCFFILVVFMYDVKIAYFTVKMKYYI